MKKIFITLTATILAVFGLIIGTHKVQASSDARFIVKGFENSLHGISDRLFRDAVSIDFNSGSGLIIGSGEQFEFNYGRDAFGFAATEKFEFVYWGSDVFKEFSWNENSQEFEYTMMGGNTGSFTDGTVEIRAIRSRPGVSGKDSIVNNIDNPYTLDEIKTIAGIKAYDDYDGWLSDIKVSNDGYTINKSKVGIFTITYTATNTAGLTATFVLNVINQDLTKPVITGPGASSQSYTAELDRASIINSYTVTDNYDTGLKVKIDSDNYVQGKPGKYTFNLSAADSSGNVSYQVHTLTVFDDIAPAITDTNTGVIKYNWKTDITDAILLDGLKAVDEIDGDIKITITDNPITNRLGTYIVKYQAEDKSGNKITHERTYEIIHTDAPTFWVSDDLINVEDINILTVEQLANILAIQNGVEIMDYQVLSNDYAGNEDAAGTYAISFNLLTTDGDTLLATTNIRVFNQGDLIEVEEVTFWQKVVNFVKTIWNGIVTAVKWIWNLIVKIVMFIPNLFKGKQNIAYFNIR